MVNDAKKHEQDDKQKRELIEINNQADHLIYETEKGIKENAEKLEDSEKSMVEKKLSDLKKAKKVEIRIVLNHLWRN